MQHYNIELLQVVFNSNKQLVPNFNSLFLTLKKELTITLSSSGSRGKHRGHVHPLRTCTLLHSAKLLCTPFSILNYIHTLVHPPPFLRNQFLDPALLSIILERNQAD